MYSILVVAAEEQFAFQLAVAPLHCSQAVRPERNSADADGGLGRDTMFGFAGTTDNVVPRMFL